MYKTTATFLLALAATATASTAMAHTGHDAASGFLHPFTGLDHILTMLAFGLCAGVLGSRAGNDAGRSVLLLTAVAALAVAGLTATAHATLFATALTTGQIAGFVMATMLLMLIGMGVVPAWRSGRAAIAARIAGAGAAATGLLLAIA